MSDEYSVLEEERKKHQEVTPSDATRLARLTVELVDQIRSQVGLVGFLKSPHLQQALRGAIFEFLYDNEIVPLESADALADRLLEVAKANHARLSGE